MKLPLTDLQKIDAALGVVYACAETILKEPDKKETNMTRARTILFAIDTLREQLTTKEKQ